MIGLDECAGKSSVFRGLLLLAASWQDGVPSPTLTLSRAGLRFEGADSKALLCGRLISDSGEIEVIDYADAYTAGWRYETWLTVR